jgi:ketosteroid isomerase-like protein
MGPTVQETRDGYAAFNAGDIDRLSSMLDEAFVWNEAREIPGTQRCESREEFVRYMRGFGAVWQEFSLKPEDVTVNGDAVYAKVRVLARGRASEIDVELTVHHVWRKRDGVFIRMDAYLSEHAARAAAGLVHS